MADVTAMHKASWYGDGDCAGGRLPSAMLVLALVVSVLTASSCAAADSPSQAWVELRPPAQVFSVKTGQETTVRVSFRNYANDTRLYVFSLEGDIDMSANLATTSSRLEPGEVTEIQLSIMAPQKTGNYEGILAGLAEGIPPLKVRITVTLKVVSDEAHAVFSDDDILAYAKVWSAFPGTGQAEQVLLVTPIFVAEDPKDRWFIVDESTKEVYVIDREMRVEAIIGNTNRSTAVIPLSNPKSVTVNSQGAIYIADWGWKAIHVLDSNLVYLGRIAVDFGYGGVECLAVDSRDRLFVAYWRADAHSRILVFTPKETDSRPESMVLETVFAPCPPDDAAYVEWGRCGTPRYIAVDSQDRIIVAEDYGGSSGPFNRRLLVFNTDLEWVGSYSGRGDGPGQLVGLSSVAVGPGDVIAACDPGAERISFFFPNGSYAGRIGKPGPDSGEFSLPLGMWVTRSGNLLVADSAKNQIQEISVEWASLRRVEAVPEIHLLSFFLFALSIALRRPSDRSLISGRSKMTTRIRMQRTQ